MIECRMDKMRDFDSLDTHSFKAFWVASELLNFTLAAKKAGLTQSGISQHISKLERQLGVPLFERVNKKVFLTDAGSALRTYIDKYLDEVEELKDSISSQDHSLSGEVSYAMPASCLMSSHFPMLLQKRQSDFPKLKLDVTLCHSDQVIEKLLDNEIHFGFVTKGVKHPGIKITPFCCERYILVAPNKHVLKDLSIKSLRELPFVEHPDASVLFDFWRKAHFPRAKTLGWSELNIVGRMNSLAGAIHMVEGGMGLAVIPEHCVQDQLKSRSIHCYKSDDAKEVTNQIHIATLDGSHVTRRVQTVIQVFLDM